MTDATRRRGTFARQSTTNPTPSDRRSAPTIREQILNDPEVDPNDHFLININSIRLRHSYHSSRMRVREWINNDLRAREIMQQISYMLNSNEQFRLDGSFSFTFLTFGIRDGVLGTNGSEKPPWPSTSYWIPKRASSRSRTTMNSVAHAPS